MKSKKANTKHQKKSIRKNKKKDGNPRNKYSRKQKNRVIKSKQKNIKKQKHNIRKGGGSGASKPMVAEPNYYKIDAQEYPYLAKGSSVFSNMANNIGSNYMIIPKDMCDKEIIEDLKGIASAFKEQYRNLPNDRKYTKDGQAVELDNMTSEQFNEYIKSDIGKDVFKFQWTIKKLFYVDPDSYTKKDLNILIDKFSYFLPVIFYIEHENLIQLFTQNLYNELNIGGAKPYSILDTDISDEQIIKINYDNLNNLIYSIETYMYDRTNEWVDYYSGEYSQLIVQLKILYTMVIDKLAVDAGKYDKIFNEKIFPMYKGKLEDYGDKQFKIKEDAFKGMVIDIIYIPERLNIKCIGKGAFRHTNITFIHMPNTVKIIEERAFERCKQLKAVFLGKQITELKDFVFTNCTELDYIELPSSLIKIGNSCFLNCKISHITIPRSVTHIGTFAFSGPGINELRIIDPLHIQSIEKNAFKNCNRLSDIIVSTPNNIQPFIDMLRRNESFGNVNDIIAMLPNDRTSPGPVALEYNSLYYDFLKILLDPVGTDFMTHEIADPYDVDTSIRY